VTGAAFAGIPGVVLGHNRWLSWGSTTNYADLTDTFQERVVPDPGSPSGLSTVHRRQREHVIPIPQVFRQNILGNSVPDDLSIVPPGGPVPPVTLIVPRRSQGPVLDLDVQNGVAISVQFVGFEATREGDALCGFAESRSLDDFRRALQFFDGRDLLILRSLSEALELLAGPAFEAAFGRSRSTGDYRWGRLHRIAFEHPLGDPFGVPPAGGAFPPPLPDVAGIPTDGGWISVDAAAHSVRAFDAESFRFAHGPSVRWIQEVDVGMHRPARVAFPGGVSGVLGHPDHVSLLPGWLTNDDFALAFRGPDLARVQRSVTRFVPGP